jgi:hypothetical protein
MSEEEFEDEEEAKYYEYVEKSNMTDYWKDKLKQSFWEARDNVRKTCNPLLRTKQKLTAEQWKIAYWRLRRKYRQANLDNICRVNVCAYRVRWEQSSIKFGGE